jgi:hypothetical protein
VPEGETQAAICKLTGLQARVAGPVLATLLERKKVVRTQIRKSSGKGETWYDAWRLASNNEFLAAKIEKMGLVPSDASERSQKRPAGITGDQGDDDTDWLDEMEVASAEHGAGNR